MALDLQVFPSEPQGIKPLIKQISSEWYAVAVTKYNDN